MKPSQLPLLIPLFALMGWLLYDSWTLPIVHRIYPTGECVAVIPDSAGTCTNLPRKYHLVWVSPEIKER